MLLEFYVAIEMHHLRFRRCLLKIFFKLMLRKRLATSTEFKEKRQVSTILGLLDKIYNLHLFYVGVSQVVTLLYDGGGSGGYGAAPVDCGGYTGYIG